MDIRYRITNKKNTKQARIFRDIWLFDVIPLDEEKREVRSFFFLLLDRSVNNSGAISAPRRVIFSELANLYKTLTLKICCTEKRARTTLKNNHKRTRLRAHTETHTHTPTRVRGHVHILVRTHAHTHANAGARTHALIRARLRRHTHRRTTHII